jgi:hypothetical protein
MICETHPLTDAFGASHHSRIHAHGMTQQQAAAGVVVVVVVVQKLRSQRTQNGASGGLCRVGPSHTHDARLAQPCLAKHRQRMPLGHATILSRLVTAGWGEGRGGGGWL